MEALRCFSFVTEQASNELRACMRHQNANFEQRIIVFFLESTTHLLRLNFVKGTTLFKQYLLKINKVLTLRDKCRQQLLKNTKVVKHQQRFVKAKV